MPRFRSIIGYGRGRGAHIVRARTRARMGVRINIMGVEDEGRMGSLIKSFKPSAKG